MTSVVSEIRAKRITVCAELPYLSARRPKYVVAAACSEPITVQTITPDQWTGASWRYRPVRTADRTPNSTPTHNIVPATVVRRLVMSMDNLGDRCSEGGTEERGTER